MSVLGLAFFGLPLPTLLWAFAAVSAVVVGLYILRLRRRRVAVAFLPLWEKSLVERKASALRSRLQRLLSLLISLLLVGALILALGDPRPEDEQERGGVLAVLIDVSASMATVENDESRMERARSFVEERIESLGPGDRMLLVEMGARPRPLEAATESREALTRALRLIEPLDVSADVPAALALARDALRDEKKSRIVIVSDGALPPMEVEELGPLPPVFFESVAPQGTEESRENVAITAFSARRYPLSADRFEVLVEVHNAGERPATIDLSLFEATADGKRGNQLDQNRIVVPAGERRSRSYENLDRADEGLIATVTRADGGSDAFAEDDVARTLLSPRPSARVLVVGPPNTFLDAALLVDDSLVVKRISKASYPPDEGFDVTIFDGVFPRRDARTGAALYLAAAEEGAAAPEHFPVAFGPSISLFGFDTWKKDSTVFRLVDPYDIQVLSGHVLEPQSGDLVLGASEGRPIFVTGERSEGRFLALGFAPKKSDFVLRSAWPLFIVNAIDELFPRGRTDAVLGLKTGTLWRPSVSLRQGLGRVKGPLGAPGADEARVVPIQEGRAVLFGQRAGFYEVETTEGTTRFAASVLSTDESRLPPSPRFSLGKKELPGLGPAEPHVERKPWFWLLAIVLGVSFVEWWTFHRRWTV